MSVARKGRRFGRRATFGATSVQVQRAVAAAGHDGDRRDGRVVETENVALQTLETRTLHFDHIVTMAVDRNDAGRRDGHARLARIRRHAGHRLRQMRRDPVENALESLHPLAERRHFGQTLGEERVQDAEVLADVDVVVKLWIALIFGKRARDLLQVLLHCRRFLLQEIVHELHKVLFALETGKVGQRLQRFGD